MRRLAITLLASSALFSLGEPGWAADMPRPILKAPVPIAAYNWTGFYVGAHLGGGWGNKDWSEPDTTKSSVFNNGFCAFETFGCISGLGSKSAGSHTVTGPLGGFQAGFNWQSGQFLIGVEGQFSWSDLKGDHQNTTSSATAFNDCLFPSESSEECENVAAFAHAGQSDRFYTKVKNLATLAARLGLVSGPDGRTLFYVKGGAAYAKDDYSVRSTGSLSSCIISEESSFGPGCFANNSTQALAGSGSRWGGMVGIGLEFALFDTWTAKVEYDYLALGTKTVSLTGVECLDGSCSPITRNFDIKQNINLVKFGINYRFRPAALVAAY